MKSFFSIFRESAKEFKNLRSLTTTAMFMALAVILRVISIQVTADIRITFAFIAIAVIAMLYGPVMAGAANISVDFIGFLLDNKSARGYYPPLALVTILAGVLYGIFLYRKEINVIFIALSRIVVVLICNLALNSYFIYTGFVNKHFELFSGKDITAFKVWITPRIIKNAIQLPVDIVLLCVLLPVIFEIYKKIYKKSYGNA